VIVELDVDVGREKNDEWLGRKSAKMRMFLECLVDGHDCGLKNQMK
jgi:hypothetical protein